MLRVVGLDPSLRNWGVAMAELTPVGGSIRITHLGCVQPEPPTGKQVRQNSRDIHMAQQLFNEVYEACRYAHAIFAEVPVGSQSARAMASYGVCIGILGALRHLGLPLYELTPDEIKRAGAGSKTASKLDMIRWAMQAHPEATWPMRSIKGESSVIESKAEHMADAVAAIHAGTQSTSFRQLLALRAA